MSYPEYFTRDTHCVDCGQDCCPPDSQDWEYYMLTDAVWAQTGLGSMDGHLCIGCCETRLGRRLVEEDFTRLSLSDDASERLRSRGDMRQRYGKAG